jgi:DNA-3-methyladenine glycosylase II
MLTHIRTEADLDDALAALSAAEPRFAMLLAEAGRPPLRRRPDGFSGLAATVVSQQLSTASAGAIWNRLVAAFDPVEPTAIIKARSTKLARIGLSRPKIKAHAALTAVHGIGPWTADIYLLTCLGHADAWPAGDLALQEAARLAFGLRTRPTTKEMGPLAEPWRPFRAVAARVLWTYYRAVKGREGAPVVQKILPKESNAKPVASKKRVAAKTTKKKEIAKKKTAKNKNAVKKTSSKRRGGNGR